MLTPYHAFISLLIALSLTGCTDKAEPTTEQTISTINNFLTRDNTIEVRLPSDWETSETFLPWLERTFPGQSNELKRITQLIALKTALTIGNRQSGQVMYITHGVSKQDLEGISDLTGYVEKRKQLYIEQDTITPSSQTQTLLVNGMHGIQFSQMQTDTNQEKYKTSVTFIEHKSGFFEVLIYSPVPAINANTISDQSLLNAVYLTGQPPKLTYSTTDNVPSQKLMLGKHHQVMVPARWIPYPNNLPTAQGESNHVILYTSEGAVMIKAFNKSQLPPTVDLNKFSIASRMMVLEQHKWLTQFDTPQVIRINHMQGVRYQAKGVHDYLKMQAMLDVLEDNNTYYQVLLMTSPAMFPAEIIALQETIKTLKPVDLSTP